MKKHGRYDEQQHLPDNSGEPRGDGSRVWLLETVSQHWPELANSAHQQQGDRYKWLIAQLGAMQDDERAIAIIEEYHTRINVDQRERAQRDRKRHLAQYEQLAKVCDVAQLDYVEKCIAKLRKQIAKVEMKENHHD